VQSGFALVSESELKQRRAICDVCDWWKPSGNLGLGECRQCGCTRFKMNYASEKCRLKKWDAIYRGTFYHAGEIGDMIYSLPTVQALGGGKLTLGPKANIEAIHHPRGFTKEIYKSCKPFLELQPYIKSVEWSDVHCGSEYDLNQFRDYLSGRRSKADLKAFGYDVPFSLAELHAGRFNVKIDEAKPWLIVDKETSLKEVVFARSFRYRNAKFPWQLIVDYYKGKSLFVGTKEEHADFVNRFGPVERADTKNILNLARVIAGSSLFVGNQSSPMSIALGLGFGNEKHLIQEVKTDFWPHGMDCHFKRKNAQYITDGYYEQLPQV
jgi:hypothetical protein